jgi:hypothetical protein
MLAGNSIAYLLLDTGGGMRDLTSSPEGRLIFSFAVPMLIGNVFLVSMVVGQLPQVRTYLNILFAGMIVLFGCNSISVAAARGQDLG